MEGHRDAAKKDLKFEEDGKSILFHDSQKKGKRITRCPIFFRGLVLVSVGKALKAVQVRVRDGILYV